MRVALALTVLIGTAFIGTAAASAQTGPVIVIPGRPGVPIMVNGRDISYAMVEGDWGLAKNLHVQPTVYGGHVGNPLPPVGHYYPSAGHQPGYGRLEIEPPPHRKLPPRAESFHQSWSAQSMPLPAQTGIPPEPPAVIVAPQAPMNNAPHRSRPPRPGRPHVPRP